MKLNILKFIVVLFGLSCAPLVAGEVMEWVANFADINLNITSQGDEPSGFATATLNMDGDVEITANNTARLTKGSTYLITEYKLTYDGDGASNTGGATVDWTNYDAFLSPASSVTYVAVDTDVVVTFYVRTRNDPGEVADAGVYTTTQTLTASWVGP